MAKRVGSDDAPKLGAVPASASVQATNQVITAEFFLAAVRDIREQQGRVKAENEKLKSIKLNYRGAGIKLTLLDYAVKLAEQSRGEIRDEFNTLSNYSAWLGLPVAPAAITQASFAGLDDNEIQRREWFALGRTYSRTGKPPKPPEECPDEFHQAFMAGFNEEDESAWLDAERQDVAEEEPPAPEPTLADAAVAAIEADSAPLIEETLEYPQPDWKGYSPDPDDWFAAQWRDFNHWYEGIPDGITVKMTHPGVVQAFRDRVAGTRGPGGDKIEPGDVDQFEVGYQASKDNQQRGAPEGLTEDQAAEWLAGWDKQAEDELVKRGAPAPKAGKGSSKGAVH